MMSSPIHAAAEKVDLELALGADVSGSVDDEEAALQRQGYIQAFRNTQRYLSDPQWLSSKDCRWVLRMG